MDYKYIEQLIERYWACETSIEEENILRTFFAQDSIPESLLCYRDLFMYERNEAEAQRLGEDFDNKLCKLAGVSSEDKTREVCARRISFRAVMRPFYQAAAAVAVVVLLVTGVQHVFNNPQEQAGWDYNINAYKDSYDNPREAYEILDDGIRELKAVLGESIADSISVDSVAFNAAKQ